ncbi:hypothetical protein CVE26_07745, partial [Pseudomonas syringae pv. actinidiae]|nr:hypothetical protein [Pseudomonas syringae pv. actinidiae]NAT32333.1 hypothetical protein [Pseudomonas syringae pv. actinidiae]
TIILTTAIVRRSASHAVLDALRPLFSVRSARFSGFTDHPRPAQFLPLKPCRHWLCKSWTAFCNRVDTGRHRRQCFDLVRR